MQKGTKTVSKSEAKRVAVQKGMPMMPKKSMPKGMPKKGMPMPKKGKGC